MLLITKGASGGKRGKFSRPISSIGGLAGRGVLVGGTARGGVGGVAEDPKTAGFKRSTYTT